jgi:hypothetical protein
MIQVITSVIVIQGFVVHIETFIHNPQRMKIKHIWSNEVMCSIGLNKVMLSKEM